MQQHVALILLVAMTTSMYVYYSDSLEVFNAVLSLLMLKTTAVSAKVRQSLDDWLQEQVLVVQLLATNRDLLSGGRGSTKTKVRLNTEILDH